MTQFSIIIPHRNIPKLLQRCLDSIPRREDIQVIVVDDNSDPDKVDFSQFPGTANNPCLGIHTEVYFTKEGKGAGYARNVGLDHAKGEWLLFADADDVFTEQFSTILEEIVCEKKADLIYFDVESKDSETLQPTDEAECFSQSIKNIAEYGVTESTRYSLLTPWAKAIKRLVVEENNITFEEVSCSNDTAFSAKVAFYTKNVSIILKKGYCWMLRQGSLWRKKNISWYVVRMQVCSRLSHFMRNHNDCEGEILFRNQAEFYMEGIANVSKIQHLKGVLWYGFYMRDYKKIYNRFPKLLFFYIKEFLRKYGNYKY